MGGRALFRDESLESFGAAAVAHELRLTPIEPPTVAGHRPFEWALDAFGRAEGGIHLFEVLAAPRSSKVGET